MAANEQLSKNLLGDDLIEQLFNGSGKTYLQVSAILSRVNAKIFDITKATAGSAVNTSYRSLISQDMQNKHSSATLEKDEYLGIALQVKKTPNGVPYVIAEVPTKDISNVQHYEDLLGQDVTSKRAYLNHKIFYPQSRTLMESEHPAPGNIIRVKVPPNYFTTELANPFDNKYIGLFSNKRVVLPTGVGSKGDEGDKNSGVSLQKQATPTEIPTAQPQGAPSENVKKPDCVKKSVTGGADISGGGSDAPSGGAGDSKTTRQGNFHGEPPAVLRSPKDTSSGKYAGKKILLLGDSHMVGQFGQKLISLFNAQGAAVLNLSVGGLGTNAYAKNTVWNGAIKNNKLGPKGFDLSAELLYHGPFDLAIIGHGSNDIGLSVQKHIDNLKKIVAKTNSVNFFLVSPPKLGKAWVGHDANKEKSAIDTRYAAYDDFLRKISAAQTDNLVEIAKDKADIKKIVAFSSQNLQTQDKRSRGIDGLHRYGKLADEWAMLVFNTINTMGV
jgi:hypothetical protein